MSTPKWSRGGGSSQPQGGRYANAPQEENGNGNGRGGSPSWSWANKDTRDEVLEGIGGLLGGWIGGKLGGSEAAKDAMSYTEGKKLAQIKDAQDAIYNLIGKVEDKTNYYRGLGEDTIRGINQNVIGRTIPEFIDRAERDFDTTTQRERDYGVNFLSNYEPGFAQTRTYGDFGEILNRSVNDYLTNVSRIGERGSQRMNVAAAETPIRAFRGISEDPSFNLLRNPTFMDLARNPETVKGDVDRYRQMWTYNV